MGDRLESGDYGDVLFVPGSMESMQVPNYFAPLGNYFKMSQKYNYLDSGFKSGNMIYTIPSSGYIMGIAYNKDVFYQAGISRPSTSIDEFREDMAMIKERTDAVPIYLNSSLDWTLRNWIDFPYAEMTGDADYKGNQFIYEKDPFTEGGTHYEVYKLLYDLEADGFTEGIENNISWQTTCSDLNNGRCACIVMGSWALRQLKDAGKNEDSVAFMPFPNEIDGKQYVTFNTDYNYAVRRDSGNLAAAKAFVEFMLDESGYALDQEFISVVRTDPYPEMYGNMEDVVPIRNGVYEGGNYALYLNLIQSVDPTDANEIRKIVKAAANPYESFDTVMQDWNRRWENGRPEGMTTRDRSTTRSASAAGESTQQNSSSHIVGIDNGAYRIMFSPTEMEYIEGKGKLRIGYLTNQAPFQYQAGTMDELLNPGFEGLSAMMCKVLTDSTGLEAEYVPYGNEEELIQALETGTLDMAAGVKANTEYEGRVLCSKEYIEFVNVLLKNEDVDVSRLEGGTQALIAGDSQDINAVAEFEPVSVSSIAAAVRSVNAHKADFAITNYYSAEYYIRNEECEHINVVPLTGIYNRTGYEARLQELSDRYGKDASMTFAVMDLDNFKSVNDSLGHAGGDEALRLLAGRLDRISGESAVAARYGGDEFMVCMFGVGEEDARKIFRELVSAMDTDIQVQGVVHHLSISLGAVHAPHTLPPAVLFMEADKVLYNVKAKGKNGFDLICHEEAEC